MSVIAVLAGATLQASHAWAGDVIGQTLIIDSGTFGSDVAGGETVTGDVSGNSVTISGGTFNQSVAGGSTINGSATGNSATISGGTVGDLVVGGVSEFGHAIGNSVAVSGSAVITGGVFGGFSLDSIGGLFMNNSVTISGGTVNGPVMGAETRGPNGVAADNNVTISGGTVNDHVVGGDAQGTNGNATNNAVTITGGTVTGDIYGGAGDTFAISNSVTISGGTIASSIIAGGGVASGVATGNTVTISGTPSISSGVILYGGYCYSTCTDVFTSNTLDLKTAGLIVGDLRNFENLNFYLPTSLAPGGTMLTVTGTADLTNGGSTSSTVNVGINGASSLLAVGHSVTLIQANTLTTAPGLNSTATGSGMQGVTLAYVFDIGIAGNNLTATVQSVGVSEPSKALSEGVIAGASFVNQGADLAAGKGMANAIDAAEADWSSFGAVSGGSIRTETGSHVDVEGVSLMAGLSGDADLSIGRLTAGVFAEYGSGSYDTFNGFASGDVRGHGDSDYVGGGLLGHMDFDAAGPGHAYAEASARFGNANNSFSSADLTSGGVAAGYDTSSLYAGASAAVGYVWNLGEATTIDVSGKYLWSRLGEDSVQLTTGETVDFDAVTSERTRLGARVSYALSNKITPYAGAAWEHEWGGKARATTNGLALDAPSMGGDTGILEAGLTLTPSDDLPLSIDLGLQGFVGQREGVAGSLQARLAF